MKTLLTIFTLVFTVMFSSTSFAEWTEVIKNTSGDTYYVDLERVRKHGGYVYYWQLDDYLESGPVGNLSVTGYRQVDCKLFRFKDLSMTFHKQQMGRGASTYPSDEPTNKSWQYPRPNTIVEDILKFVCNR